jgi:hypothetical protein
MMPEPSDDPIFAFDSIASILVERGELIEEDRPLREAFLKRKLTSAGLIRERRHATKQRKSRADFVGSWMAPPQSGLWFQRKFSGLRIFCYGNHIQPTRADSFPRSIH